MKINKKRSSKKVYIVVAAIVGIIGLLLLAFYVWSPENNKPDGTKIDLEKPTSSQISAGYEAKKESIEKDKNKSDSIELTPEAEKETVNILISAANQKINGDVDIRTSINTLESDGTCILTMRKNTSTQAYTDKASTQIVSTYSTCNGFLVPASQLTSGSWIINLSYTGVSTKGEATPFEITLKSEQR